MYGSSKQYSNSFTQKNRSTIGSGVNNDRDYSSNTLGIPTNNNRRASNYTGLQNNKLNSQTNENRISQNSGSGGLRSSNNSNNIIAQTGQKSLNENNRGSLAVKNTKSYATSGYSYQNSNIYSQLKTSKASSTLV